MNIAIPRPHRGELHIKEHALGFFKAQPVLVIAFILAVISAFVIPPDAKYKDYCNTTVLIQLFGLMIAVSGVRSIGVFDTMTGMILKRTGTVRRLGFMLMLLCFFMSMLVTNDVVLLTFVPLTLLIFKQIPDEKSRILTLVLETAAANLGSMLTPVGNPQNLYIYSYYDLSAGDFFRITAPVWALSLVLLLLLCLPLPNARVEPYLGEEPGVDKKKLWLYLTLFAVCLLAVFRVLSWQLMLTIVVSSLLIMDRKILLEADFLLLLTFVAFFVFSGNLARLPAVAELLRGALAGREYLTALLASQVISNVPAALLLSGFTGNARALLLGVDVGGLGTPIASLASLISLKLYSRTTDAHTGRYLAAFTAVNVVLLLILSAAALLLLR